MRNSPFLTASRLFIHRRPTKRQLLRRKTALALTILTFGLPLGLFYAPTASTAPLYVLDPVDTTRTIDVEPTDTFENVKSKIEDSFLNSATEHVVELRHQGCGRRWRHWMDSLEHLRWHGSVIVWVRRHHAADLWIQRCSCWHSQRLFDVEFLFIRLPRSGRRYHRLRFGEVRCHRVFCGPWLRNAERESIGVAGHTSGCIGAQRSDVSSYVPWRVSWATLP